MNNQTPGAHDETAPASFNANPEGHLFRIEEFDPPSIG